MSSLPNSSSEIDEEMEADLSKNLTGPYRIKSKKPSIEDSDAVSDAGCALKLLPIRFLLSDVMVLLSIE